MRNTYIFATILMLVVVHFIQPFNTLLRKILKYVLLECPARPAGMSCYTGINRESRTSSRTNRTPGNPGSVYLFITFFNENIWKLLLDFWTVI